MPTLNEKLELGAALFTQPRDLGERRVYGTATAASSGGSVSVDVGGETVTIPTVGAVAQGDEVVIQVQNGHPVAIGVRGWGDAIQSQVDETASYVWLDQYGHLRVTPLPKEQQPTTGVTIDANSVDIISDDYTSSLTDGGLTVIDNNAGNIVRMATASVDPWYTYPTVMGAGGLHLAATNNDFDSQSRMFDALTIFAAPPASGQFADTVAFFNWGGSHPVMQVKTDCIALPDDYDVMQDVHATATSSRLGAVKVGDGLSIDSGGTLSWDGMTILSYGHSTWQDFIDAYNANRVVYCRASSNSNPGTGAQTRMAFMAYVNADPPTNVEFQYYRSVSSHSATQQGDQVYIYKLTNAGTWSVTVREASVQVVADTGLTRAYASNKLTIGLDDTGWTNVATGIRARVVGKMMTVVAIGYTTDTTSGWATVGTLPASVTGGTVRFLACKYSDGTTRRGEIDGNTLKLHQPGTAIGVEFTVTVPVG